MDNSDVWFHPAYDEGWRTVATFRSYWDGSGRVSDSSPKEQFVNAMAGLDGYGRSSYINDVVCRERDNTNGWLAASDGTLEERYYYCPNWRGDVSVLVHSGRYMAEWVKYSAYGVPFGLPGGDTNSDGDNDAADATQIQTWINASAYDVRGDVDLDGDVDSTDKTLAQASPIGGVALGRNSQTDQHLQMRKGFAGYELELAGHVSRRRTFRDYLGVWSRRDPLIAFGAPAYQYSRGNPIKFIDSSGLAEELPCPGGTSKENSYVHIMRFKCEMAGQHQFWATGGFQTVVHSTVGGTTDTNTFMCPGEGSVFTLGIRKTISCACKTRDNGTIITRAPCDLTTEGSSDRAASGMGLVGGEIHIKNPQWIIKTHSNGPFYPLDIPNWDPTPGGQLKKVRNKFGGGMLGPLWEIPQLFKGFLDDFTGDADFPEMYYCSKCKPPANEPETCGGTSCTGDHPLGGR